MVQDSRNCVPKERNEKNVGEEGLLCAPQGPRGGIFFFPISSFSTTLSRNRYIYICIPVSKAADRKSKTKVSFFSLGGRSWDTFLFPPLSTPFFRRHRLLLSLPFPIPTISYHSCHPQPFSMFDVLPLALPPSSLSLSLSASSFLYRLLSQRTRACSFRPESFLSLNDRTPGRRGMRRKSKERTFPLGNEPESWSKETES